NIMNKIKQTEQKEIGRVKLSDTQELVASIVDNEKLDLRVFVKTDSYTGATRRDLTFCFFDGTWRKFKRLVHKMDKVYE
ncbi:unnamed protein product, partial [marine sediment metagenome]